MYMYVSIRLTLLTLLSSRLKVQESLYVWSRSLFIFCLNHGWHRGAIGQL